MVFNSKTNEMIPYVNVFGSGVVAAIFRESNSSLTIRVEWDRMFEWAKDFSDESSKPKAFLCCMGSGHIFSFSS